MAITQMMGILQLTVAREQALMKSILVSVMLVPTATSKLLELVKAVTKDYSEDTSELTQKEKEDRASAGHREHRRRCDGGATRDGQERCYTSVGV